MADTGSRFTPRQLGTVFGDLDAPSSKSTQAEIHFAKVEIRNGLYYVDGLLLPTTSPVHFANGQDVPVLFENGAPVAIVGHDARRSGLGTLAQQTGLGIVEGIAISTTNGAYNAYLKAPTDANYVAYNADTDVWFADKFQVTRLGVRAFLNNNGYPFSMWKEGFQWKYANMIQGVTWSERTDVFLITLVTWDVPDSPTIGNGRIRYMLFKLDRKEDEVYPKGKRARLGVFPGNKPVLLVPIPSNQVLASGSFAQTTTGFERFTEIWASSSTPRIQRIAWPSEIPNNVAPDLAPRIFFNDPTFIDLPTHWDWSGGGSIRLHEVLAFATTLQLLVTRDLRVIASTNYSVPIVGTGYRNYWLRATNNTVTTTLSLPVLAPGQSHYFCLTSTLEEPLPDVEPERMESWASIVLELIGHNPTTETAPFGITWAHTEPPYADPPTPQVITINGHLNYGSADINPVNISVSPMIAGMTGVNIYHRTGASDSIGGGGFDDPVPPGFTLLTHVSWSEGDLTPRYTEQTSEPNLVPPSDFVGGFGGVGGVGGVILYDLTHDRVLFDTGGGGHQTVSVSGFTPPDGSIFSHNRPVKMGFNSIAVVVPFEIALRMSGTGFGVGNEYFLMPPQLLGSDDNVSSESSHANPESPTGWDDPPFTLRIGWEDIVDTDIDSLNALVQFTLPHGDLGTLLTTYTATGSGSGASWLLPNSMEVGEHQFDANTAFGRQTYIHGFRQDGLFDLYTHGLFSIPPGPIAQEMFTTEYINGKRDPHGNNGLIGGYTAPNFTPCYGYFHIPSMMPIAQEEGEEIDWDSGPLYEALYYQREYFFKYNLKWLRRIEMTSSMDSIQIFPLVWGDGPETALIYGYHTKENDTNVAIHSETGHWWETEHGNGGQSGYAPVVKTSAVLLDGHGDVRYTLVPGTDTDDVGIWAATSNHVIWSTTDSYWIPGNPAMAAHYYHAYLPTFTVTVIGNDPGLTFAGPDALPISFHNGTNRGVHTEDYRYDQAMHKIRADQSHPSLPDWAYFINYGFPVRVWDIVTGKFLVTNILDPKQPVQDKVIYDLMTKGATKFDPKAPHMPVIPFFVISPISPYSRAHQLVNVRTVLQPKRRWRKR